MNNTYELEDVLEKLRNALNTEHQGRLPAWLADLHDSLGELAGALREEVPGSAESMKNVGKANPNFQNVPVAERHVQKTRQCFIQLGEQAHQLRSELRSDAAQSADPAHLRGRVEEIIKAVDAVRKDDDSFLMETLNSNPGSGE